LAIPASINRRTNSACLMPVFFDSFASFLTCGLDNHIVVRFMPRVWLVAISESMGQSLHDSTGCTSPHIRQVRSSHLGRTADLRSSLIPCARWLLREERLDRRQTSSVFIRVRRWAQPQVLMLHPPYRKLFAFFAHLVGGKILAVEPRHTSIPDTRDLAVFGMALRNKILECGMIKSEKSCATEYTTKSRSLKKTPD